MKDNNNEDNSNKVLEMLVCPITKGRLQYDARACELISVAARLAYPIKNGKPIMCENKARELSLEEYERWSR